MHRKNCQTFKDIVFYTLDVYHNTKEYILMNFSQISFQVQMQVLEQLIIEPGTVDSVRLQEEYDRICSKDPEIRKFFNCIKRHRGYKNVQPEEKNVHAYAIGYALTVYQMIEEQMRIKGLSTPTVSRGIKAPLKTEIRRLGFGCFVENEASRLHKTERSNLMGKTATFWIRNFSQDNDTEAAQKVLFAGICVYRLLKSQWELNKLEKEYSKKTLV